MPLKPTRVMTLRNRSAGEASNLYDDYMIVSFAESSLILSIQDGKISSVQDSGFSKSEPTLHAAALEDGSFVQVTARGIVHVRKHVDPTLKNTTWQCDPKRQVVNACSNSRQVVVQVGSDQVIYFELDLQQGGILVEKGQQIFKQPISCLALAPVPAGRLRFKFLIAGFGDSTVRVLSLEPETCLDRVSIQALPSAPSAVLLSEINDLLLLHIGLENGVLLRTVVDAITGGMSDSRSKFLGVSSISLAEIQTNG
jgi:splicing factor 3B subunit 3